MAALHGKDVLRADQFTVDELHLIMDTAARLERAVPTEETPRALAGKIMATLFYEPSTRTRLSFESAMLRLGGQVISVAEARTSSSAAKGETLYDTGKMIESYAHVAVIRHPAVGSAQELAEGAAIPVINGGDGAGEHPTQALLDLYTIKKERGRIEGLTVAMVGDLKHGRTVHSLATVLANFDTRFYFVAPTTLAMPAEVTAHVRGRGREIVETPDLAGALAVSDVLYVTRIQKERFTDESEYRRVKNVYVVDTATVRTAKAGITIMHPLPRVDEITKDVDAYAGAAYFRQAANGVWVRMALLALLLDKA
ncbi:MAG: aspartate carbamoyltransferase [Armatimonadota bacterium]|nr:aspartate carbamoyltransferase [Armatimonadota bacterium]